MGHIRLYIALMMVILGLGARAQENKFAPGESLKYGVYYYLMGVWVGAGEVTFSVEESVFQETPCLKFTGYGQTHKRYDWFYKVRDTYEAYASPTDLTPYRFRRDVSEGDFYFVEDCLFDHQHSRVFSVLKVKEKAVKVDTSALMENSFDVLSMIYHARNLDFSSFEVADKIPINMFVDRETHQLFIRYLGTEVYDHDEYGEIECYVFSPLLVEGTLFKSGEKMKVYVTKDSNVIPVYIESEIRVGSIRAELTGYEGLRAEIGN
ncbi:MAG TPA: DUF3108 domain-containing protein [Flavobacteriales bacterium]|jgi:hypothetical protein|nr:DUF3108 domain-containing protein [Flavobacteriales bacterium]